ncbi:MAG TPA: C-terminal binding protein [bacterium]|nr:C-terminal binding protein [bacterium]
MKRFTVVVTDSVFPSLDIERSVLGAVGAHLMTLQATREDELLEAVEDADGLLVCYAPVTQRVIERASRCRVIARYGIGVDNVDLQAAAARGIVVTNVPDYCIEEVSDHALALILACARRIVHLDRLVHTGRWDPKDALPIRRLQGQVLGLVGFGKIPRRVAAKAAGVGLLPVTFDPFVDAATCAAHGAKKVDLSTLLTEADFVSVHAPLTAQTRGLIGDAELRRMKPTAFLINTARGPVVREAALVKALQAGWIAGAALDVVETEPLPPTHPLMTLPQVLLTPHVAFYSQESMQELQRKAAEEVARVLTGHAPHYAVPLPSVPMSQGGR